MFLVLVIQLGNLVIRMSEKVLHVAILCQSKRNKQDELLQEVLEGVSLSICLVKPQNGRNLPLLHLFWLASIRFRKVKSVRKFRRLLWQSSEPAPGLAATA